MKFTCNKSEIIEAINTSQKGVTGKSTMAVLQGLYLKAKDGIITLIGSDRDISIETKFTADIEEEGSLVLDSRLFGEIIRKLPNSDIYFKTMENNTLEILCNKSIFNIVYMNSEEYPELPNINEEVSLNINQEILKTMVRGTIFAVAQEETRPILTGVLFEIKNNTLNMVALDGYRLALKKSPIDIDEEIRVVIPGKTLNEVSKIMEEGDKNVNISFTKNHILFNIENTKIISILLSGEFIKYSSIIPEDYSLKVTANRSDLLSCIERASLLAKDGNTNLVRFDVGEDNLVITSNSQLGNVREEMPISLEGEPIKIAFNSKYLIDVLKIMDEEEIVLEFTSPVSPCILKNKENDNCTYLILPVRLLNN
jgi:DNA polymerase III subunit beta